MYSLAGLDSCQLTTTSAYVGLGAGDTWRHGGFVSLLGAYYRFGHVCSLVHHSGVLICNFLVISGFVSLVSFTQFLSHVVIHSFQ